jgi:hypothetical protein
VDYTPEASRHSVWTRSSCSTSSYPESPRLWERHVTAIPEDLAFVPTTHEPCIYRGTIDGHSVLFLRQVDDFAMAVDDPDMCEKICDPIDTRLNEPIKRLGLLELYNGTNIEQTRDYIRLHSTSYTDKILAANTWIGDSARARVDRPVPMNGTSEALRHLDTSPVPSSDSEREKLERSMGFSYRKAIGELIWAMVTCRPDLSFAVIKLSQFSSNSGRLHYNRVRHVFRYLQHTRDYGLTYWRTKPCPNLPDIPAPPPVSPNLEDGLRHTDPYDIPPTSLFGYVDSNWANDIRHRRSVSGIAFLLAGAVVAYKTRVQPTVSTSSTEAEFIGASDAAKMALYIRSILDELHVPQTHATLIYEDNAAALMIANKAHSSHGYPPFRNPRVG